MEENKTYSASSTTRTIMEGKLQTGNMEENRTYEECRNYISASLTTRTILEQLAEESAELSQAALKLIRASGASENKANISIKEAEANLIEEIRDVLMIIDFHPSRVFLLIHILQLSYVYLKYILLSN